uniref:Uncharacterized protein n=1 Tax=Caenorhabditis japonica TaxID=281687 RepID=A0A8R1DRG5_CAEJA
MKKFRHNFFAIILLLAQLVALGQMMEKKSSDQEIQRRERRQNGYGNGDGNEMWGNNNGYNFPNSNGYNSGSNSRVPVDDDSIKGSVGEAKKEEKERAGGNNWQSGSDGGEGGGPMWPNDGNQNQNGGYGPAPGPGPEPNGYNGNVMNGYNNGPNPFAGGTQERNVDTGIVGSVGVAVESTRAPNIPNGYGNNAGPGNFGNQGFGYGMPGYGNNLHARRRWHY